jgi:hypothetical protein
MAASDTSTASSWSGMSMPARTLGAPFGSSLASVSWVVLDVTFAVLLSVVDQHGGARWVP